MQHMEHGPHAMSSHYGKSEMPLPEQTPSTASPNRKWWRLLLGAVTAVALVLLFVSPELAALGFLFDPALLDVALLLFGTQLMLFNGHIQALLSATWSGLARRLKGRSTRR